MRKLLGGILLAIGALIAGASGLCSLAVLVSGVSSGNFGAFTSMLVMVGIFGGLPFAIGAAIFFAGTRLLKEDKGDGW